MRRRRETGRAPADSTSRAARAIRSATLLGMLLVFAPGYAGAQGTIEITPYAGLQFGGDFDVESDEQETGINIDPGLGYGIAIDFRVDPQGTLGLSYTRQDTEMSLEGGSFDEELFDVAIQYFHAGGAYEFQRTRLRSYVAIAAGATLYDAEPANVENEWRLSGNFNGGFKAFLSPTVALRVQGTLFLTLINSTTSLFCELPGGCLVVTSGESSVQGLVSAGLTLAL